MVLWLKEQIEHSGNATMPEFVETLSYLRTNSMAFVVCSGQDHGVGNEQVWNKEQARV